MLSKENIQKTLPIFEIRNVNLNYGEKQVLKNIDLNIYKNKVTAFIGPSGCGKSTLLRCFNRMNDLIENCTIEGTITYKKEDINQINPIDLRTKVGMVFQNPNPFPMSIFDNIAYGPRCQGIKNKEKLRLIVEDSLKKAGHFEEVKERLSKCCKKSSYFVIPAGEENKNLDTVKKIYEHLILEHFDRKDMLAALGGGVIGDMCGFTAASYLRGIDFVQVPTTLLSQVDSSIGGKTGVDFKAYKNMVGAFYMPKLVYMNLSTLNSLPEREYLEGMGEIIKHGLLRDKEYFYWL